MSTERVHIGSTAGNWNCTATLHKPKTADIKRNDTANNAYQTVLQRQGQPVLVQWQADVDWQWLVVMLSRSLSTASVRVSAVACLTWLELTDLKPLLAAADQMKRLNCCIVRRRYQVLELQLHCTTRHLWHQIIWIKHLSLNSTTVHKQLINAVKSDGYKCKS